MIFEHKRSRKDKVSPENPTYRASIEHEHREKVDHYYSCFGSVYLPSCPGHEEEARRTGVFIKDIEKRESMFRELMTESIDAFLSHCKQGCDIHTLKFLSQAMEDVSIATEVKKLTADYEEIERLQDKDLAVHKRRLNRVSQKDPFEKENRLHALLLSGGTPPALWQRILEQHQEQFLETQKRFEDEILPGLKKRFLERARKQAGTDLFPISFSRVEKELKRTTFVLHDGLGQSSEEDVAGLYHPDRHTINLANWLFFHPHSDREEQECVFDHEVFHSLSARMVLSDEQYPGEYLHPRVGLGLYQKFHWLDEGFTEFASAHFHRRSPRTYLSEVQLLKYLMEKGNKKISPRLFANAYFENHEPDATGVTIPHWRMLRKALNEAFDPRFLTDLDADIQKHGLDEVLKGLGIDAVEEHENIDRVFNTTAEVLKFSSAVALGLAASPFIENNFRHGERYAQPENTVSYMAAAQHLYELEVETSQTARYQNQELLRARRGAAEEFIGQIPGLRDYILNIFDSDDIFVGEASNVYVIGGGENVSLNEGSTCYGVYVNVPQETGPPVATWLFDIGLSVHDGIRMRVWETQPQLDHFFP